MRLSAALFVLFTPTTTSFTILDRVGSSRSSSSFSAAVLANTVSRQTSNLPLFAEGDDYDDWYDDFDPAAFEEPDDGNFMGSGSGHDYSRDEAADNSRVDLATVNALIADRLKARKVGQFDKADAIRDELLDDHGVLLRDKERIWRSGCSRNGSGQKWLGGRQREGPKGRGKQDFGPNGHDYDLVADAGPNTSQLSEGEIHSLIAERLQFKLSRDFSNADRIQEQLFSAGVAVHDGMKIWRADGEGFGDIVNDNGKPGRERGSRNDRNRPYEQSPFSLETNDVDAIQALVAQRTEAKMIRNFGLADALRDELREDFNVEVDDRKRLWSVGGDFGGRDNRRAPGPFQLAPWSEAPEDLEEIQRLVQMRDAARADRDFATADDIRDELADRNIFIDDKAREFSLGPNPAVRQSRTQQRQNFVMSALSELPDNAAEIQRLVEMRDAARADRDYATADQIRDELVEDFNVFIDDRSREWAVGNVISKDAKSVKPNGVFTRTGGGELSEEEEETILALLKDRDFAKCEKDYAVADSIRERLNVEFQVQVDDINREWHVVTSEYVQARDSVEVEASVQEYISSQVAKRAVAKLNKEYDVADEIRDELETEYNVRIDDRVKVWSVQNAPSRQSDPESGDLENVTDIEESEPLFENISEEDLQALTVPELKERLKAAGKPVSGRKAELIERLVDA